MSYSIKAISFSPYKDLKEKERHERIVLGRDAEQQQGYEAIANRHASVEGVKTLKKGVGAAIATDIFVKGASATGELAAKSAAAAGTAGFYATSLGALLAYDKAIDKITDHSDSIKEARQQHPFATAILYMTGGLASMLGANSLLSKTATAMANRFPNQAKSLENLLTRTKDYVNSSWINNEIVKPISKLSERVATEIPTIAGAAKKVAPYVPLAVLAGAAVKSAVKANRTYKEDMEKFESAREKALLQSSINKINELDQKVNTLFVPTNASATSAVFAINRPIAGIDEYDDDYDYYDTDVGYANDYEKSNNII